MTDRSDSRLAQRLSLFTSATSCFSMAVGLSALAGWVFHVEGLKTWGAAPVTIKVNTATCFVLIGFSLWLLRKRETQPSALLRRLLARATASIVCLVGLLSLAEYFTSWDFGLDQWLMLAPPAEQTASVRVGLMSPLTAFALFFLGLALLGIDWRTRRGNWPAQFFSLSAGAAASFGILTFAFDPHIYASHLSLALPSAVTLAVFSLALVCARTEWGLGALLCSQSLGGKLARRLLPAAFIPVVVGWTRWQITATGFYSEWTIVVLAAMITMSLLAGLIAWAAVAVDRSDVERRKVEEALHFSKDQLNRLFDRFDESPNEALLRNKVTLWFAVAVLLTGLLGVSSWHNVRQAEQDADWVTHTQEVLKTLQTTLRHLMEVEIGARGFALSGHEPLLQPYETGRLAMGPDLDGLRHLTADNPSQQRRLDVLGPQVTAKIEANDGLVGGRRQTQPNPHGATA
jgi:hypothetical protein